MISLEGSVRTCKVDTGWANKLESDRFLNPNLMVCPIWNGVDTTGRSVCHDSYYTKREGCNNASDRVDVENALRPQYIEYINLDAAGIRGSEGCKSEEGYTNPDTICNKKTLKRVHNKTGQFGLETGFSQIFPNCLSCNNYPNRRAYGDYSQSRRNEKESYGHYRR